MTSRADDRRRVLLLTVASAIVFLEMGTLFSLAVFLKPIEEAMGWRRSYVAAVAGVNWIALGCGALAGGWLSDRIGLRVIAIAAAVLVGGGTVLASQASEYWQFTLAFGVLVGFGVGATYVSFMAAATKWFSTNRALAAGVVSTGIGVGIMAVGPLARLLIDAFGWRMAMLAIGDFVWLAAIPAAMVFDNRRVVSTTGSDAGDESAVKPLTSWQFYLVAATHFACCAAHSGPVFHMVTNVMERGMDRIAAAGVFSVFGLASIAGRLATGVIADRVGAKWALAGGLLVQASGALLYAVTGEMAALYALSLVFGLAYGGVMPLYPVVLREIFGERTIGAVYGTVFFVSTLGMGLGSFAGGAIHDLFGTYLWLYAGSFVIGLSAVAMACFIRVRRPVAVLATS